MNLYPLSSFSFIVSLIKTPLKPLFQQQLNEVFFKGIPIQISFCLFKQKDDPRVEMKALRRADSLSLACQFKTFPVLGFIHIIALLYRLFDQWLWCLQTIAFKDRPFFLSDLRDPGEKLTICILLNSQFYLNLKLH